MKVKKPLQKFTETEVKINNILALKQITYEDLKSLTQPEREHFMQILTEKLNTIKGDDRDEFLSQVENITTQTVKNQLWENNHLQITSAISTLMQDYGCMPTKNHLAEKTGLSRQTIHKHIKEYSTHPRYLIELEQFRFMTSKVLAKVFQFAINGDIGAAKLYFNVMGFLNKEQAPNNTLIQNQNNFIQINGTVLSQESIKQLSPEQLNTIENILKAAIPQPNNQKEKAKIEYAGFGNT